MSQIGKIMDTNVLTIKKEATVSDAAKLLAGKPYGCAIITESEKPVGIITESDIVRNLISKKSSKIKDVMSSPVTTLSHDTKLEKAGKIIETKHFRRYPVVNGEGILVGMVTENDVVQAINDNISFHRNLQNAVLIIFVVFEFIVFFLYRYLANIFAFLG